MVPGLVRGWFKGLCGCRVYFNWCHICVHLHETLLVQNMFYLEKKKNNFFHLLIAGFGMHLLQKKLSLGRNVAN